MRARIHCAPEEKSDLPGYYAFFVFDPDGIRVEVCHWSELVRQQRGRRVASRRQAAVAVIG
jgi:hypothetical protein